MNAKQIEAIQRHGERLLAVFPSATERDPIKLCKALRRLESQAHAIALRLCNGPEFPGGYDAVDRMTDRILGKVNVLLGNIKYDKGKRTLEMPIPIFVNRDPRGYALKIREEAAAKLAIHHDWGGYGIIAPEIKASGQYD